MEYFDTRISIIYWKIQYGVPVTTEEAAQLAAWEQAHPDLPLHDMQDKELSFHQWFKSARLDSMSKVLQKVKEEPVEEGPVQVVAPTPWYRRSIVVAASIVGGVTILLFAIILRGFQDVKKHAAAPVVRYVQAHHPADTAVMVELTDGSHLPIGTNDTGLLVRQGAIELRSLGGGQLVFEASDPWMNYRAMSNKISNLERRPVQIQLPDNSIVQLDAQSQLHVNIGGSTTERSVSLAGIAYFTVTHDSRRPFTVHANGTDIQVLGTEFAVNATGGKTTVGLTKGSVSVAHGNQFAVLKPGQVVSVKPSGEFQWQTAALNDLVAFKGNNFYYQSADLPTIKTAIEQWYGVELTDLHPSDSVGPYHFGPVPRDLPLEEILEKVYKLTGHRFRYAQRP